MAMALVALLVGIALALTAVVNRDQQRDLWTSDFSGLSYTEAFDQLHQRMVTEYAFTEWKGVDWDELNTTFRPLFESADREQDATAYYVALRGYLRSIPDGHVSASAVPGIEAKLIGGSYGLTGSMTDDGPFVITWVSEGGPAEEAGIQPGVQVTSIDGLGVEEALTLAPVLPASVAATDEGLALQQQNYLFRAPIGAKMELTYRDPDGIGSQQAVLTAQDDQGASMQHNYPAAVVSDRLRAAMLGTETSEPPPESMVETKTVDDGIVVIKVWGIFDADLAGTGETPSTLELFRHAVAEAEASGAPGIIVDLRNNVGGLDEMAADMLGSFYSEPTFYEYQNVFDPSTGQISIANAGNDPDSPALLILPAPQTYQGDIIALVNNACISSCEGIAMGISNLPNGEVVGIYGTNGSFGMTGPEAVMPEEILVKWPSGQSLDKNKVVQLDSRDGVGGVAPTVRVPLTKENSLRLALGQDLEMETAIDLLRNDN